MNTPAAPIYTQIIYKHLFAPEKKSQKHFPREVAEPLQLFRQAGHSSRGGISAQCEVTSKAQGRTQVSQIPTRPL